MENSIIEKGNEVVDMAKVKTNEEIEIVEKLNVESLRQSLLEAKKDGFTSVAVVLMHSYAYPEHEIMIGELAEELGFRANFVVVRVDADGEGGAERTHRCRGCLLDAKDQRVREDVCGRV
jgi:N-methylhydantoinase A/oxoprolinase/acetone carboxylase beta subunit